MEKEKLKESRIVQKILRVEERDFDTLSQLLNNGWIVKSMSACAAINSPGTIGQCEARKDAYSFCYVLLEKQETN